MTVVHSADQVIGSIPTEQAALSVADILDRAADLIEPEGAWTQGRTAVDQNGRYCDPKLAVCRCAAGAIIAAGGGMGAMEFFDGFLGEWATTFNDKPSRTQAEVVAALRTAAEKARTACAVGTSNASEPSTPAVSS